MSSQKKIAAIVITTVALTAGTVAMSSAATKATKVSRTTVTRTATTGIPNPMANGMKAGHDAEIAAVLAGLVTKGTITQAQADAITAALAAAETAEHANAPEGGPMGSGKMGGASHLTLIATTLGITEATLQSRLAAGETLASIAGAKKDALIAALVADESKQIDAAVTAGKITAAQATTLKATLTAHVTAEVNATAPVGGPMGGGKMGGPGDRGNGDRGHGPMGGMGKAPSIPTPTTTTSATA